MAAGSFRNESLTLQSIMTSQTGSIADMALRISGPVKFFLDPENKIEDVRFNEEVFETSRSWIKISLQIREMQVSDLTLALNIAISRK